MADSDDESVPQLDPVVAPEEPEEDTSLANSDVTTKYQEAAKVANAVMKELTVLCVEGAKIIDICKAGDALIDQKVALIYRGKGKNGKPIVKGAAFPVCVSVNEVICHCSPLDSDTTLEALKNGDVAKIDLAVHIDGYIAAIAHSIVVAATPVTVTGTRANAFNAAYAAAEVAVRLIRPGNTNHQVTEAIQKVATAYGVAPISGTVMHQMKRFVIDGNKVILLRAQEGRDAETQQKVETCEFEVNEVYAIDVAVSTGEGRPKEKGTRTTVYKRIVDKKYALKSKVSRAVFSEINKRFPTFPFSLRDFSDEKNARLGLRECVNHDLVLPYPVLSEKEGDDVAHFKFTVLVLASGTSKITGVELPEGLYASEGVELPEDIQVLLATDEGNKKKKKKKKASKKKADDEAAAAGTA